MIFYGRHIISHIFSPDKDILGLIFGKLAGTPGPISLNRLCYSLDNLWIISVLLIVQHGILTLM